MNASTQRREERGGTQREIAELREWKGADGGARSELMNAGSEEEKPTKARRPLWNWIVWLLLAVGINRLYFMSGSYASWDRWQIPREASCLIGDMTASLRIMPSGSSHRVRWFPWLIRGTDQRPSSLILTIDETSPEVSGLTVEITSASILTANGRIEPLQFAGGELPRAGPLSRSAMPPPRAWRLVAKDTMIEPQDGMLKLKATVIVGDGAHQQTHEIEISFSIIVIGESGFAWVT